MIITFTNKVTVRTDMRRDGEIEKSERAGKRFASTPTPRIALVPGPSEIDAHMRSLDTAGGLPMHNRAFCTISRLPGAYCILA